jgi:hypothetical protein
MRVFKKVISRDSQKKVKAVIALRIAFLNPFRLPIQMGGISMMEGVRGLLTKRREKGYLT